MSAAAAKKFMDDLDKNKKLQTEVRKNSSKVQTIAKKNGYSFTSKELKTELARRWGTKKPPKYADPDTCCLCLA